MFPEEFRDPDTARAGERKWDVLIPLGLDASTAVVIQDWADSMKTSPEAVIRHLIRDGLNRRRIE